MLYLITYYINKDKDHTSLHNAIKNAGEAWWHYIDTTWIIKTTESATEISNRLLPYIEKPDDSLLVIKVDPSVGNKQGWLPQKAWDWINENGH